MTTSSLQAALRAGADGRCALEAGTGLIIAREVWAERCDFGCFIHHGTGTAAIDWEAAIAAPDDGARPGSGGERRMLRLAASLAGDIPVRLGDAVTGIDQRNAGLLVTAILHACGQRQFPLLPHRRCRARARRLPANPRGMRRVRGEQPSNDRDREGRCKATWTQRRDVNGDARSRVRVLGHGTQCGRQICSPVVRSHRRRL